MTLTDIEDRLLARAELALGAAVRGYLPLAGGIAQLGQVLTSQTLAAPAVLLAWRGSDRPLVADRQVLVAHAARAFRSTWSVLTVVQHPAGELGRRRGDARGTPGAAELAERLALALHDYTLPGIGTVAVIWLGLIESEALAGLAVTVAEVRLSLAHDFAQFDADALPDWMRAQVTLAHPCPGTPTPDTWTLGPLPAPVAAAPRLDDTAVGATAVPGQYLVESLDPGAEE